MLVTLNKSTAPGSQVATGDRRGRHPPKHSLSQEVITAIDQHIETFNPCPSHYGRKDVPSRRYISPDFSLMDLYTDFELKHNDLKISRRTYARRVGKRNISFAKLENGKCEACHQFRENHEHSEPADHGSCQTCQEQLVHINKVEEAHRVYIQDTQRDTDEEVIFSAGIQQGVMLPYMKGVKSCALSNRLVVFNQIFVPLGEQHGRHTQRKVRAVVWHEAVADRSVVEITSAFVKLIADVYEEAPCVTIWCEGWPQNKNWVLYTSLARVLNSNMFPGLRSVTLKYLEAGHTSETCDSFQNLVEKRMRKDKSILNFKDFRKAVEDAGGEARVISMEPLDFRSWDQKVDKDKLVTIPRLSEMAVVRFERNSKFLMFKVSHSESAYSSCEFLLKDTLKDIYSGEGFPGICNTSRGIPMKKRDDILQMISRQMEEHPVKRYFWESIPVNDLSTHLANTQIDDFGL